MIHQTGTDRDFSPPLSFRDQGHVRPFRACKLIPKPSAPDLNHQPPRCRCQLQDTSTTHFLTILSAPPSSPPANSALLIQCSNRSAHSLTIISKSVTRNSQSEGELQGLWRIVFASVFRFHWRVGNGESVEVDVPGERYVDIVDVSTVLAHGSQGQNPFWRPKSSR